MSNWARDSGYYNAKTHKKMLTETQFRALLPKNEQQQIIDAKYEMYVVAWKGFHAK